MNIKIIKMTMAILLICICSHSKADLIYDFVCDADACGETEGFSGFFAFDDNTDRTAGARDGDFNDFSLIRAGGFGSWGLGDAVYNEVSASFSANLQFIDGFMAVSGRGTEDFLQYNSSRGGCGGGRRGGNGRGCGVGVSVGVENIRMRGFEIEGRWELRGSSLSGPGNPIVVDEPSALSILALSLLGLAVRRFKKQS